MVGRVRIHRSALRHGITVSEIVHAWDFGIGDLEVEREHDPPKRLRIGPDYAGNYLELVYLESIDGDPAGEPVVIHAMALGNRLRGHLNRMRP